MVIPTTGRNVRHGGGRALSLRSVPGSTTLNANDAVIIGTGGAVTITLPDPTALLSSGTLPAGREFSVKNINAAALTVVSAGTATIDGATSKTLAQYESRRYVTDGTNWYAI